MSRRRRIAESERRWKGRTPSQRAEPIALFVLDLQSEHPSWSYAEVQAAVRKHFECGQWSAELGMKRARDILHERASDPAIADKVAASYWEIYEDARLNKDRGEARRTLDSLRAHFGIGAPDRRHVTGAVAMLDLEKLSDAELAEAAGLPREIMQRAAARAGDAAPAPNGASTARTPAKPDGSGN